jgi:phospholipase C
MRPSCDRRNFFFDLKRACHAAETARPYYAGAIHDHPKGEDETPMTNTDRRTFLRILSGSTLAAALPESIGRALAIPAHHRTGTIKDVEHIVILMQENRSFDHYFGSLRGVRGFSDPTAVRLPSGKSVWHQPSGATEVLPFHPTAPDLGLQFLQDLPHSWADTQGAWNSGKYDHWVPSKGKTTMAYLTRDDIPFHYALADAFTICDAYHCSFMGSTDPNRYYMWTGWTGNDGKGGGPVLNNAEAGYDWSTYPELLEQAGISWKIYQDVGVGLDANGFWGWTDNPYIGNYGDNSLLYFHQYQNALPGSPLYQKARTGTNISAGGTLFDVLQSDVKNNTLPKVSWIVAPEAYTEHPNWPANYGAWYVSQVLDALTANPDLWSKTALFINYDENDGFFDHIVPPSAPVSPAQGMSTVDTTNEIFAGNTSFATGPYGLGPRVPMIVVSPWSKGGFVCSETFDHTSLIRFIEQRFGSEHPGLREAQISAWRRAVCGDLTAAFDFKSPNDKRVSLPSTQAYAPPDQIRHADYKPVPPTQQAIPLQEPGLRFARALPYELSVDGDADLDHAKFEIKFTNTGDTGAWFQVRSGVGSAGPWSYTVEPNKSLSDSWDLASAGGLYDLSVHGPNGFLRSYKGGNAALTSANLDVDARYDTDGCDREHRRNFGRDNDETGIALTIGNRGRAAVTVSILDVYANETSKHHLKPGQDVQKSWSLRDSFGWYDFVISVDSDAAFEQRLAGHVENGDDSMSDPALGGSVREA